MCNTQMTAQAKFLPCGKHALQRLSVCTHTCIWYIHTYIHTYTWLGKIACWKRPNTVRVATIQRDPSHEHGNVTSELASRACKASAAARMDRVCHHFDHPKPLHKGLLDTHARSRTHTNTTHMYGFLCIRSTFTTHGDNAYIYVYIHVCVRVCLRTHINVCMYI